MNTLIKISLQGDEEFERLLCEYKTARSNLQSYLWKEDLTAVEITKKETASGN